MRLINLQQSTGRFASPSTQCKSKTDNILIGQQSIKAISENNAVYYFLNVLNV